MKGKAYLSAKYEALIVGALFILGILVRFIGIADLPLGLNADEASAGYEAWSILSYGIDRAGNSLPVLLKSWGSGQNALYSYLSMPFIASMGLNVLSTRILSAIAGCLTLAVFWLLARRLRGRAFGVCALFLLVINPWHIMISRWALEANLLPFFLILGIYLTSLALDKPAALPFAAASFGLSLYAYGTAFVFLPVYLVCGVFWLVRHRSLKAASFIVSLAVFALIAFPIAYCQLRNMLGQESLTVYGITLPKLSVPRQNSAIAFSGVSDALGNYKAFLSILLTGSDGWEFNSLRGYGLFYIFGLPLAAIGLIVSLSSRRDIKGETPILFAVLSSFIAAFFIVPNINRMNMVFLPMIYLSSVGLYWILCRLKWFSAIPVAAILVCFVLFLHTYFNTFSDGGYWYFFPGLGDAIEYTLEQDADCVFITSYVNQPYIYALFYSQTPPDEFLRSAAITQQDWYFHSVSGFAGFRFGSSEYAFSECDLAILKLDETGGFEVLEVFGDFAVCRDLQ